MPDDERPWYMKRPYEPLLYVLAALPALFFLHTVYKTSVDIPILDDYESVLGLLIDFTEPSAGLAVKLAVLLSTLNGGAGLFAGLFALIFHYAPGPVDFSLLTVIGFLPLALLAALIFIVFRGGGVKVLYLLPVPFILFHPGYYGAAPVYPTALLSGLIVPPLALGAFILASRGTMPSFIAALVLALAASYGAGGGLLVFPVGFIAVAAGSRDRRRFAAWAAAGAAAALHLLVVGGLEAARSGSASSLSGAAVRLLSINGEGFFYPAAHGALSLAFIAFLTWRRHWEKNPALYSFIVFLPLAAAVSAARSLLPGAGGGPESIHAALSLPLFAALYAAAVEMLEGARAKALLAAVFVFAVFLNVYSYAVNSSNVMQLRTAVSTRMARWVFDRNYTDGVVTPDYARASGYLDAAAARGIYRPDLSAAAARLSDFKPPEDAGQARLEVERVYSDASLGQLVEGWAFDGSSDGRQRVYITLSSDGASYVLQPVQLRRPDIAKLAGRGYDNIGFMAYIQPGLVAPGEYRLGVYVRTDGPRGAAADGGVVIRAER